tara:strand:- start:114 stop:680 length:567 start_codon:yes stop_codon:yes gene_type:complete
LELILNYFEDLAGNLLPQKFKVYGFLFLSLISGLLSFYLFGKYQDKIEAKVFKKFKNFNLEKSINLVNTSWLAKKIVKVMYGKCYHCNQSSLEPISYRNTQKLIFNCKGCNKTNKTNFFYSVSLLFLCFFSAIFLGKLYLETIKLLDFFPENKTLHKSIIMCFSPIVIISIYTYLIKKINVNTKYDLK